MKIKRDPLDVLFSQYMRLKAKGVCERCGRKVGYGKLQVSHLFGRRYKALRWDEDNVSVVCFTCHMGSGGFHDSPVEHVNWFIRTRGQDRYDMLVARSRNSGKNIDKKLLEVYFKQQIALLSR